MNEIIQNFLAANLVFGTTRIELTFLAGFLVLLTGIIIYTEKYRGIGIWFCSTGILLMVLVWLT